MHADLPAEIRLLMNEHVAGQLRAAGARDASGVAAVVGDVHVGHQVVVIPDLRDLPFSVAPVHRDVFAERILAADAHEASLACEPAVLGFFPQDHADAETVALPERHAGFYDAVRPDQRAVTDHSAGVDHHTPAHHDPPTPAGPRVHHPRPEGPRLRPAPGGPP